MIKRICVAFAVAAAVSSTPASAQQKMDDMKGMSMDKPMPATGKTHKAVGVVKAIDTKAGTVTVAHGPVPSLNWDAMTMTFDVKDKGLLKKFTQGKKVEFEFVEQGENYVVTGVK